MALAVSRARPGARADPEGRVAPVRGRRRPALVARARRARRAHAHLRRPALAALRGESLSRRDRRPARSSTTPSRSSRGRCWRPIRLESYFEPRVADEHGTLFEHCARTIDRSLGVGAHGLPLMGTGDWNDGMNRVGRRARGRACGSPGSCYGVLTAWAPIAAARGRTTAARTRGPPTPRRLKTAVERDGGTGAGTAARTSTTARRWGPTGADACAIDSIAQSWSVMSGAADPDRARRAMESVDQHLVRPERRPGPPADAAVRPHGARTRLHQGIRARRARERRAVYACGRWTAIAFATLGDGDQAAELLAMLNPITHTRTRAGVQQYRVEPYVVVGDVYSEAPHVGRGGWTWYTGSAGWLYRAGMEWLLGMRRARNAAGDRSVHSRGMAGVHGRVPVPLGAVRHRRRESRWHVPRGEAAHRRRHHAG